MPEWGNVFGTLPDSPPPRSAPSVTVNLFGDFSPPLRVAPAAQDVAAAAQLVQGNGYNLAAPERHEDYRRNGSYLAPSDGSFINTGGEQMRSGPYGRSLPPGRGEASDSHTLSIMTSDNNWDAIAFGPGDDLSAVARQWILGAGLNPAFQKGLVTQMRQMVNMRLVTASVDIVDLL